MPEIFSASIRGSINGRTVSVDGSGYFDFASGVVRGNYRYDSIPEGISPLLFNCVKVTGYPSVCAAPSNLTNPFRCGSYSYSRMISLGENGHLRYSAECIVEEGSDGELLKSDFIIEGQVDVPPLFDPAPIVETWAPAEQGCLRGRFDIIWPTRAGGYLIAEASTTYVLPDRAATPDGVLYRCMKIVNGGALPSVSLVQNSTLLREADFMRRLSSPRADDAD